MGQGHQGLGAGPLASENQLDLPFLCPTFSSYDSAPHPGWGKRLEGVPGEQEVGCSSPSGCPAPGERPDPACDPACGGDGPRERAGECGASRGGLRANPLPTAPPGSGGCRVWFRGSPGKRGAPPAQSGSRGAAWHSGSHTSAFATAGEFRSASQRAEPASRRRGQAERAPQRSAAGTQLTARPWPAQQGWPLPMGRRIQDGGRGHRTHFWNVLHCGMVWHGRGGGWCGVRWPEARGSGPAG